MLIFLSDLLAPIVLVPIFVAPLFLANIFWRGACHTGAKASGTSKSPKTAGFFGKHNGPFALLTPN